MRRVQKFNTQVLFAILAFWVSIRGVGKAWAESMEYPEFLKRSEWDAGCSDWELKAPKIAGISVFTERKAGAYRIYSTARLETPKNVSAKQSLGIAQEILSNGLLYPEWVMPGINHDPFGNPYFVKLESVKSETYKASHQFAIQGLYSLEFLWAKIQGHTSIIFKHTPSELPQCPSIFESPSTAQRLTYRMIPRPGVLDYMITEAFVSQKNEFINVKLRAVLKPDKNLYELIPEKVISGQVEKRARRIFENFSKRHRNFLQAQTGLLSKPPGRIGK